MEQEDGKPKRRIRYKGTHPRTFKEKYKELQPEKYADAIERVKSKGGTPAGMHRSICVDEILEVLQPKPGQVGMDATLGYGGHSLELLKRISPGGHLYATDVDPFELPKTTERLAAQGFGADIFSARKLNFSQIDLVVAEAGLLHFVLADLGVSSMQIDNPDRGFSLKADGPLDLRLNPKTGQPASALLKTLTEDELEALLLENADEPYASDIAATIMHKLKKGQPIETTEQLKNIIKETLNFLPEPDKATEIKKACQRCFQALRITVNDEFGVLDKFLAKLPDALAPGGKVAILTFHSGEDRRVKKAFQAFYRQGVYSGIATEPIRPTPQEIGSNPRARSAKLRWAIKA